MHTRSMGLVLFNSTLDTCLYKFFGCLFHKPFPYYYFALMFFCFAGIVRCFYLKNYEYLIGIDSCSCHVSLTTTVS